MTGTCAVEAMVQGMKIGSERVLPLTKEVSASTMRVVDWARVRDNEAVGLYVRLIGNVGHPCSRWRGQGGGRGSWGCDRCRFSDEEEKKKGNLVDFHVCGEVNERTERIRLFCESGDAAVSTWCRTCCRTDFNFQCLVLL